MGSGSQRRFVDWEEKFVSHDRGSRVVHYYLKDRHGHQCLAVIGTERSLRHMVYVVCDDFLPLAGLDKSTTSAFKWRARREVVDWLSTFLTKSRSPEAALPAGDRAGMSGEAGGSGFGDAIGSGERNPGGSRAGGPDDSGECNQSMFWEQELHRYHVGSRVEVLCGDSGLRGKWLKATVLEIRLSGLVKVGYDDLTSCEDGTILQEWKSCRKVAQPCKMGVRISDRLCIRPHLPKSASPGRFDDGESVDVWWDDGWWEGIVCDTTCEGTLRVFFPGEGEIATVELTDVRVARDWVNGGWTAVPRFMPMGLLKVNISRGKMFLDEDVVARYPPQYRSSSRDLARSQTLSEGRSGSPVRGLIAAHTERAEQSHSGDDSDRSAKEFVVRAKEESSVISKCEQAEQNSLPLSAAPRSPRSGGPVPQMRGVFRQSKVMPSNVMRKGIAASPGITLKWAAGRKRHRQGDYLTSKVERNAAQSVTEVKDCSTGALKQEVISDGENEGSGLVQETENLSRWRNGDGEDLAKHKKQRKGNDNSLKTLHGTPMGSSLFIGALPLANLVMSR